MTDKLESTEQTGLTSESDAILTEKENNYTQFVKLQGDGTLNADSMKQFRSSGAKAIKLALPEKTKKIADEAFKDCKCLETVTFNAGTEEIGARLFDGCDNLKEIIIPKNSKLKKADEMWCSGMPSNQVELGDENGADPSKEVLDVLKLPAESGETGNQPSATEPENKPGGPQMKNLPMTKDAVEKIAGAGKKINGQFKFPEGGNYGSVGEKAFFDQTGMTIVEIPATIKTIGNFAFGKSGLQEIRFEAGSQLTELGGGTFYKTKIKSLKVPGGVKFLRKSVCHECTELERVEFEEGSQLVRIYPDAFKNCAKLKSIQLPESVEEIASTAFDGAGITQFSWAGKGGAEIKELPGFPFGVKDAKAFNVPTVPSGEHVAELPKEESDKVSKYITKLVTKHNKGAKLGTKQVKKKTQEKEKTNTALEKAKEQQKELEANIEKLEKRADELDTELAGTSDGDTSKLVSKYLTAYKQKRSQYLSGRTDAKSLKKAAAAALKSIASDIEFDLKRESVEKENPAVNKVLIENLARAISDLYEIL